MQNNDFGKILSFRRIDRYHERKDRQKFVDEKV